MELETDTALTFRNLTESVLIPKSDIKNRLNYDNAHIKLYDEFTEDRYQKVFAWGEGARRLVSGNEPVW
ncbi:MAG: hypothetical protein ABI600_05670 [Luteolibacter sp.]